MSKKEEKRIWKKVKELRKKGLLSLPTEEDLKNEPTALANSQYRLNQTKMTEKERELTRELRAKYVGLHFRYHSKYGGVVENILCEDICVCETIQIKNSEPYIESYEVIIISDKRNSYDLNDVEFY